MIYDSVVDGLKVFLGNFVTSIALLITYLIYGRPPSFEGDQHNDLEQHSRAIFIQVVIGQIYFAICSYLDLFHYDMSTTFTVVGIILYMIILI